MTDFDMLPALRAKRRFNRQILIALGVNWSLIAAGLLVALAPSA